MRRQIFAGSTSENVAMRACRFLFVCAFCVSASTGQELRLAPGAQTVTVSPKDGHYTEPSVAINRRNPKQVVVVYQGGKAAQGTASAAYSVDGGESFEKAQGTSAPEWKVLGDVTTTFDSAGNAYVCSIAFDKLASTSYWAHGAGRNGIIVRRSTDGGRTWDAYVSNVKTFPTGKEQNIQFEDEPRIYADNNLSSPFVGSLYVGWVEWQLTQSVMYFSRSTDRAKTWSQPIRISTKAGLPRDDNGGLGGYSQATGPDGVIYSAWSDGNGLLLATSKDGGQSFTPSRPVVPTGPVYFGDVPGIGRVSGFPSFAMDVRKGQSGKLYLCWSDYTNGDVDVFVAASEDHGQTWSAPVRVNNDPIHNGEDQFFPWMTVDPVNGSIFVLFYDRRADAGNDKVRMTLARSVDEAHTFQNYALTSKDFNPVNAFLGDYTGIDAYNNHVVATWTETTARASRKNTKTVIKVGVANFK